MQAFSIHVCDIETEWHGKEYFPSKEMRDNIYNQRKKWIKPGNPSCSVYSLMLHRQQLFFSARKLVKARKIYAAWSQQGNVLVKKEEDSKRMLGTFNQHLPMILSNNYWCQSKPTSLLGTESTDMNCSM